MSDLPEVALIRDRLLFKDVESIDDTETDFVQIKTCLI